MGRSESYISDTLSCMRPIDRVSVHIPTAYGQVRLDKCAPAVSVDTVSEYPVLLLGGFAEGARPLGGLGDSLAANEGLISYAASQPRKAGQERDPLKRQSVIVEDIVRYLAESTGRPVHVVAHSIAAQQAVEAALRDPDNFASLILMEAVGTSDVSISRAKLVGRTIMKFLRNSAGSLRTTGKNIGRTGRYSSRIEQEARHRRIVRIMVGQMASLGVIARNPMLAAREVTAISHTSSLRDSLQRLTSNSGIPVHFVEAPADEYTAKDRDYEQHPALSSGASLSEVADRRAGHDTLWTEPRRAARIIGQLVGAKQRIDWRRKNI
jgi:pimeloyl-ACP methyl ester carboxylesterase